MIYAGRPQYGIDPAADFHAVGRAFRADHSLSGAVKFRCSEQGEMAAMD